MRHRVYGKHLGRDKDERDTLFKGLVRALLLHGTIEISSTKAKAIKGLVDKVINLAKDKNKESRLESLVADKSLRERLVKEIVPGTGERTSGYTSSVKVGTRLGDQTTMVRLSLIGSEILSIPTPPSKKPQIVSKQKIVKPKTEDQKQKVEKKPVKKTTRSKK